MTRKVTDLRSGTQMERKALDLRTGREHVATKMGALSSKAADKRIGAHLADMMAMAAAGRTF